MLQANQTLDMTPIGMVFHIVKTASQTNGQSLEMEWQLLPKADGTPLHIHPTAVETYKVLEGQLELNVNGNWLLLQAGQRMSVPAGTPHTFRNPTNGLVKVYNTHAPAMQFGDYFEGLQAIVEKLARGNPKKLTLNLTTVTHLSMLMKKYSREMVSVNPPSVIVTLLNLLGKWRGFNV